MTVWYRRKLTELLADEAPTVRDEVLDALEELERDPDSPPPSLDVRRLRGPAARIAEDGLLASFPHGYRVTYKVVHYAPPVYPDPPIVRILDVKKLIVSPPVAQDRGPVSL